MTCLGIWSSKGCHASAFGGSTSPKGPRRSSRLDLPRGSILGRLSCLSLPGDLYPDPRSPRSQVATVLGRMSLHHGIFPSTVDKLAMIYNPLILPSTGHAGDIGDTQLQSRGPRGSTCLDQPRDLVLENLSRLNLLGDLPIQGSQEVITPRPAQGPNSQEANLPRSAWGFDLQEAVMPQPAWRSAP